MPTKEIFNKVNLILSEWNPLSLSKVLALDEYRGYVPKIIKSSTTINILIECLEKILIDLGVGYDKDNENHKKDLLNVANSIKDAIDKL